MPENGTLYRLGRGISEGIIGRRQREDEKKLRWTALMAELENMEAKREQGSREFRAEHRLAREKWSFEVEQALAEAARDQGLNEAQIESLKALTKKRLAEAEAARLGGKRGGRDLTPEELEAKKARARLETEAAGILLQSLDLKPPLAPVSEEKSAKASRMLGIKEETGKVGEKDVYKAYQSLMELTTLRGDPVYTEDEAWRIANKGQEGYQPGQSTGPATTGAVMAGKPTMAESTPQTQRLAPESTAQEQVTREVTPTEESTDIQESDTPEQAAQKILAVAGRLNEQQLRILEQNLHADMPEKAAEIMAIVRRQMR